MFHTPHITHIPVTVSTPTGDQGTATLGLIELSDRERTHRALWSAAKFVALGAVLLVIPLVGLTAPVFCWVTAAILFVRRVSEDTRVVAGEAACPHCGAKAPIAEQRLQWPIVCTCPSCRWELRLDGEPAAAALHAHPAI